MFGFFCKPNPETLAKRLRKEAELGLLLAEQSRDLAQSHVDYYQARLSRLPEFKSGVSVIPPAPPMPPALTKP